MQNTNKIEIKEISTKKEQRQFLDFPIKLYRNCPYFAPPLYLDEKKIFSPNYVYYDQTEAKYYLAMQDGNVVGRISAIFHKASNEKWNEKRIRFTRFDCIDNQQVANALFDAVFAWGKSLGMDEVVGPLGFSDLEREGLLIDGFDQLATFEEQYNFPYYQKLIENYGFTKDADWIERKVYLPKESKRNFEEITQKIFKRYNLHFGQAKNIRQFLDKYADKIVKLIDVSYDKVYGTVPFSKGMKQMMIDNFKLIVSLENIAVICDENENVVCFGLCLPSIAKALQKSGGRLTPLALLKLLKSQKHPEIIDLALVGVLPEYQSKGVGIAMISRLIEILKRPGVKYAETNLNLEDNDGINNSWKNFDSEIHKRRRSFVKKID